MVSGRKRGDAMSEESLRFYAAKRLKKKSRKLANGCVVWTGYITPYGYGSSSFGRAMKNVYAHRLAFALHHDMPVKFEEFVLHKCDNPPCINPDHLYLGTQKDNMADKVERARQNRGETHYAKKFTESDIRKIRKDTRTEKRIAADYGVTGPTIGKIRRHERWVHVK